MYWPRLPREQFPWWWPTVIQADHVLFPSHVPWSHMLQNLGRRSSSANHEPLYPTRHQFPRSPQLGAGGELGVLFLWEVLQGPMPQLTGKDSWPLQLSVSSQNLSQPKMYQLMPKGHSHKRSKDKRDPLQGDYFLVAKGKAMKNQAFPPWLSLKLHLSLCLYFYKSEWEYQFLFVCLIL